ncbi:MAG TPA: hypothetical protein IGS37_17120 [Synechococcales cyanobacterium M55_K2018_004]|nr:hypothetical protein [Synechococcales cyanobacterium M55_K2018_004]
MNQSHHELRRAAARAFMESLDQLGTRLAAEGAEGGVVPTREKLDTQRTRYLVRELEDAVADIERFTQQQE